MKVYIVVFNSDDYWIMKACFDSKEKAENYLKENYENYFNNLQEKASWFYKGKQNFEQWSSDYFINELEMK